MQLVTRYDLERANDNRFPAMETLKDRNLYKSPYTQLKGTNSLVAKAFCLLALFFFFGCVFWPLVFSAIDRDEQFQQQEWNGQ